MKALILLAALMAVSAPAYAQQKYTCQQVRAKSCSELKFIAWWHSVPPDRSASIARKCRVSHCLAQ